MRVDIFCRVIDNWGDAGVCWRLARQWAREYEVTVRLWIDQPQVLAAWMGEWVDLPRLSVASWHEQVDWSSITPADCVIEAFACEIPSEYVVQMRQCARKPHWLNLEYLSAESWVEGSHLLPSPQDGGLRKVFFFPGFTERTGGLLRERDLLARRDQFVAQYPRYWSELTGFEWNDSALKISLFGYEHMPLMQWLPLLAQGEPRVQLAVTYGKASDAVRQAWAQLAYAQADGDLWVEGQLQVCFLPMLTQAQYDQLLWSADLNAVRGEDSLVRALWAGKPLMWDIYKQDDGVHWDKLTAFARMYGLDASTELAQVIEHWWRSWNAEPMTQVQWAYHWRQYVQHWGAIREQAQRVSARLAGQKSLVEQLMDWLENHASA